MKKTFSNFRTLAALLMAGAAFAACSSDDNIIENQQPANPGEQVYTLTINASKGDGTTRALDLDGTKLVASWANGDELTVFNLSEMAALGGTLTASNASGNSATFSGTLTGTINVGNTLILTYHDQNYSTYFVDFGNQDGTLKGTNGAEKYDCANAEVTVKSVDAGNITIEEPSASFKTWTAMLKLTLKDGSSNLLNATSLTISVDGIGDLLTFSSIDADASTANGDGVLYFALPCAEDVAYMKMGADPSNIDEKKAAVEAATVTFTATVGGNTYSATKPGYKFTEGKYYAATLTMAPASSAPAGAIDGKFTIDGSGHQVYFSQGNLQATYDGSSWTWDFATNQWDYIGDAAGNTSIDGDGTVSASNVTVDLFGWVGASSTWTGAAQYGISNSTATNDASTYGNVADETLSSDWGKTIDASGTTWRTLTKAEWNYVFKTRTTGGTVLGTASARYAYATINTDNGTDGVKGVILFPDGVDIASSEVTIAGNVNATSDYATKCTTAEWAALAAKGCVFLPAAGRRNESSVSSAGSDGYYWSSSPYTSDVTKAYYVYFRSSYLNTTGNLNRKYGCSVRLVRPVE